MGVSNVNQDFEGLVSLSIKQSELVEKSNLCLESSNSVANDVSRCSTEWILRESCWFGWLVILLVVVHWNCWIDWITESGPAETELWSNRKAIESSWCVVRSIGLSRQCSCKDALSLRGGRWRLERKGGYGGKERTSAASCWTNASLIYPIWR